jgi:hypothetical protein
MRCENCGWTDNPDGATKCQKCNAPLEGAAIGNNGSAQSRETMPRAAEEYAKGTATGCPSCGYPVRPGDAECPQCGAALSGVAKPKVESKPEAKETPAPAPSPVYKGTAMGNTLGGRKLVGFMVTYSNNPNGEFFPLYEGRNCVGRDAAADVCVVGDTKVSGKHLSVLYRAVDGKFKFRDEQSSHGTFVNGALVDEGELHNADVVRAGETQLVFMEIPMPKNEQA